MLPSPYNSPMQYKSVELCYGARKILSNIHLSIDSWEFIFLIGASGSGKTSFIKSLVWELPPTKGSILINSGESLYQLSRSGLAGYRRKIGVVFQDFKLLETKTVGENVAFAMEVSGYCDSLIAKRLPEVLTEVGMLSKKNALVTTLSWGEAQRVGIARALIHNPEIIIGDEPTGNLDPANAAEIMTIFRRLHAEGRTIIISTHDSALVDRERQRVIEFKEWQIQRDQVNSRYHS
jgi:cell division transport system ATP-binding protein